MSSSPGSISAFHSGNTSAFHALETIIEPGTTIGEYQVGKMIGRGGIAAVYQATHKESGDQVALKILDVRFTANTAIVERFLNEAETLAQFHHPNIVGHINHGRDEDFVYLAMEFVPGITLDQLYQSITMEAHHYAHIAHEISKGLTCVHAAGIIHGDVKPSNILVTREGDVKISDFGSSSRAASRAAREAEGKKVQGTSVYIAPEVLAMAEVVDHRADVYSLAVTFYKILTGKLPEDVYEAPSQVCDTVPPAVDAVIDRGLRINPDDRYVTLKEFCDAFSSVFDENSLTTPVPITPDPQVAAEPAADAKPRNTGDTDGVDWKFVLTIASVAVVLTVGMVLLVMYRSGG